MSREGASVSPVITSSTNPHIKLMRSLGRRKVRRTERAFLVEGRRLVQEAAQQGAAIRTLIVREDIPKVWIDTLQIDPQRVRRVAEAVFNAASDVEHAQGVAAVCELPERPVRPDDLASTRGLILILDRMRDPGNLGTTLRSAAAAGVDIVLTTPETVDPMSPKVVRSGMGAHFRLRIDELSPQLIDTLTRRAGDVVYADAAAPQSYTEYQWSQAIALIVGGETEELTSSLEPLVTRHVSIPMQAGMESLNAGVAASILLFEVQRQQALDGRFV